MKVLGIVGFWESYIFWLDACKETEILMVGCGFKGTLKWATCEWCTAYFFRICVERARINLKRKT